ncbi:hypothetical protein, partial [Nonomuraea sp. NPDC049725]|uniref:hypothetical protein n=1 Tax=Nonomuraea sp. NPDC049725 TaxID=3154508 RepID=UPI003415DE11
ALALDEAAALVRGAQQIAQRHPVDAAAVMLLARVGNRISRSLINLLAGSSPSTSHGLVLEGGPQHARI